MKALLSPRQSNRAVSRRLSSPDHLTQMIEVTSNKLWTALLAVLLLLILGCTWGIFGRIPTPVMTRGMIVRRGGVLQIVSHGSGIISNLNVHAGQRINANQAFATIAQPALVEKIKAIIYSQEKTRADQERALTFRTNESHLRIDSANQQQAFITASIKDFQAEVASAVEQVHVQETLFKDGIVSKLQVLTAQQHLVDLNGQLADRQARLRQLDADRAEYGIEPLISDPEFRSRMLDLETSLQESTKELRLAQEVSSPYAGEVIEVKVTEGTAVALNAPILTIQADAGALELVSYVQALDAKTILNGMEVQISPSTIKREEYGYIKGIVTEVFSYPATPAAIMREFGNEALVTSLTNNGPVTELRVSMQTTHNTASGLVWSSSAGPPIRITSGTICTADVITRKRSPITIAFPFLERSRWSQTMSR